MAESFSDRWLQKAKERGCSEFVQKLVACGTDMLPEDAAPCVSFQYAAKPKPIWEVYGFAPQWSLADRERLSPYRMIGSDGTGNPICVEEGTNAVVLLDHEDRFRTRQFVNSSVRQLGECLLAYMGERDPERSGRQ